jgi:ankyrin repeat protein
MDFHIPAKIQKDDMKPTRDEIFQAAISGEFDLLRALSKDGADFNEFGPYGDSLLEDIISILQVEEKPFQYKIVKTLIELGADPNEVGIDPDRPEEANSSPLTPAMLGMDTEMLKILLEAGADPNKVHGFTQNELFYDWAESDYCYEIFNIQLPDEPTDEDKKDEDSWLKYLDRMAIKYNVRRPDHLFLLRKYGARSIKEIRG